MKIRPLRGDDIFTVLNLFNKLELAEPLEKIIYGTFEQGDKTIEQVGIEVATPLFNALITNLPKAKDDVNSFLADLTDVDVQVIERLPIKEYIGLIKDFFTQEDLKELFQQLSEFNK